MKSRLVKTKGTEEYFVLELTIPKQFLAESAQKYYEHNTVMWLKLSWFEYDVQLNCDSLLADPEKFYSVINKCLNEKFNELYNKED